MKPRLMFSIVLLFLMTISASLFAEQQVGKITQLSGNVQIDAFGKGAFIKAITGDILYAVSVVKTDPEARVTIAVQGKTQEIPPGATVAVQDLLSSSQKKGSWFTSFTSLIQSLSSATKKTNEEVVLGSRAAEVSDEPEDEWMTEASEAEEALARARMDIAKEDWSSALSRLEMVESVADPDVSWDMSFWKGYCFYQLGDYRDAAAALSPAYAAMSSSKAAPPSAEHRRILLFQLGSSWFFINQEKLAIPLFEALVADRVEDASQPYAYLLLSRALVTTGDAARSRTVAQEALKKYRGTAIEQELAALAK